MMSCFTLKHILKTERVRFRIWSCCVSGDDAQSTELLSTWDDPQVSEAAQGCVAIKLNSQRQCSC
uniref:Uncharacterized protein n=1 Tax=Neogobius melanostomus TaxID=47308 RepID=A0A8C6UWA1_9GOBI